MSCHPPFDCYLIWPGSLSMDIPLVPVDMNLRNKSPCRRNQHLVSECPALVFMPASQTWHRWHTGSGLSPLVTLICSALCSACNVTLMHQACSLSTSNLNKKKGSHMWCGFFSKILPAVSVEYRRGKSLKSFIPLRPHTHKREELQTVAGSSSSSKRGIQANTTSHSLTQDIFSIQSVKLQGSCVCHQQEQKPTSSQTKPSDAG